MIASQSGEIECFSAARAGALGGGNSVRRNGSRTSPNTRSRRASRSCTVRMQFAETGLPKVLGDELRIAPAQILVGGRFQVRATLEQIPDDRR